MARCPNCGAEAGEHARFCPDCGQSLVGRLDVQERRRVTALFADLVASTAVNEQLDPEVVRSYVSAFFDRIGAEVRQRGGSVEKFSGDAALALFGLHAAHEDDPERAVRAALAIHGGLAEIGSEARERHGLELQARIGIESGEVVVGDPFGGATMATGDPLNLAARLEQRAAPGEIIVGPRVHEATNRAFRYEPAGEWDLAGKRLPVSVWRVMEPIAGIGEARGLEGLSAPLTGRDEELSLIIDAARRATTERKSMLFTVLGVPGVGKSRLVREVTERLTLDGWRVLRGRCLPYGDGITYWPVSEMVRELAKIGADVEAGVALGRLREAVEDREAADRLAFAIGLTSTAPVTGEAMNAEIAWAFRRLTEQLTGQQPMVLVFEDIHWAEPPLLDLIEHLATWVRGLPLLLICLARPELLDARPSWGAGRMEAARIHLEPLSREETAALIRELLRIEGLPAELRDRILDSAEGNPLFVEETVRMLIDHGQIVRRGEHWVAVGDLERLTVPDSIEALIRARLDTVPQAGRATLQAASVIGRVFSAEAAERLVGGPVTDHLEDAVLRDLLLREPVSARSYRFRHLLIRDVAYATLPKARRAALHEAVVDWLSDWAGDRAEEFVEIEAYHLEQAVILGRELEGRVEPDRIDRAVRALERSARKARQRDDHRALVRFAERALALGPEPAERHAELDALLLDGLTELDELERGRQVGEHLRLEAEAVARRDLRGWALHAVATDLWVGLGRAKGREAAVVMLHEARRDLEAAGDREHLYRVVFDLGWEGWWLGEIEAAIARWDEAAAIAEELGDRGRQVEVRLRQAGAFAAQGRLHEARRALTQAEALAMNTSRLTQARLWRIRSLPLFWEGEDPERAQELARRALGAFAEIGSPSDEETALEVLAAMRRNEGDLREAVALHERQLALLREIGHQGRIPEAARHLSEAYLELGDLVAAERYADLAREVVADDDMVTVASSALALGRVRDLQGRDSEAEQLLTDALATAGRTQFRDIMVQYHLALAEFFLRRGRRTEGERHATEALEIALEIGGERGAWLRFARRRLSEARAAGVRPPR